MALDEIFLFTFVVNFGRDLAGSLVTQVALDGSKGSLPGFLAPGLINLIGNLLNGRRFIAGVELKPWRFNGLAFGFEFFYFLLHRRKRLLL